jgi:hypothetical protein
LDGLLGTMSASMWAEITIETYHGLVTQCRRLWQLTHGQSLTM